MNTNVLQLQDAVALLKRGGVLVFPTETAYAIGCDATNAEAAARVAKMKRREDGHTMPVIVASIEMARAYANMSDEELRLARGYWPGPLTIVLHDAFHGVSSLCVDKGTMAMRVPNHPIARALCEGLGKPLIATSANVHGRAMCYRVEDVVAQFSAGEQPDGYVDGGVLPQRDASTIVEVQNGQLVIHRQGSIVPSLDV
ncbi:threonylcarbamoyl-AMP synthase [Candidatus Uhrbacteria bacterium]|nr:threonylcarbamoyl-AMP synthase [Candidatus Uhrbacteria bacterium]